MTPALDAKDQALVERVTGLTEPNEHDPYEPENVSYSLTPQQLAALLSAARAEVPTRRGDAPGSVARFWPPMTPALKAMIKAMGAEIEQQVFRQMDTGPGDYPGVEVEDGWMVVFENSGAFDLARVARAGLTIMREPTETMVDAALNADLDINWSYEADGRPGGPDAVWPVMIDAILGKHP